MGNVAVEDRELVGPRPGGAAETGFDEPPRESLDVGEACDDEHALVRLTRAHDVLEHPVLALTRVVEEVASGVRLPVVHPGSLDAGFFGDERTERHLYRAFRPSSGGRSLGLHLDEHEIGLHAQDERLQLPERVAAPAAEVLVVDGAQEHDLARSTCPLEPKQVVRLEPLRVQPELHPLADLVERQDRQPHRDEAGDSDTDVDQPPLALRHRGGR